MSLVDPLPIGEAAHIDLTGATIPPAPVIDQPLAPTPPPPPPAPGSYDALATGCRCPHVQPDTGSLVVAGCPMHSPAL